jgi:hypothetical protein
MYIGDVGFGSWEEVDMGIPAANYGWPAMEGPQCYVSDCSAFTPPEWYYAHGDEAAVMLGPVCRSPGFPPEFRGGLLAADLVQKWMKFLPLDASGHVVGPGVEFDRAEDLFTVVDMNVGPDGALYYLAHESGSLWRVSYVGNNQPPVPTIHAEPTSTGYPPLVVRFSAGGSFDNDDPGGTLSFFWEFGDGETAQGIAVDHLYTVWGRRYATVTVSDGELEATSREVAITLGYPPVPMIDQPPEGTIYRAGDVIAFSGTATDIDTGYLEPACLSWTIDMVHNTHTHPVLGPVIGAGGEFAVPSTGHTPDHAAYRVSLTATDGDGITTTVRRTIYPEVSLLSLNTDPPGIVVYVDGAPEQTPEDFQSVVGFTHVISAQQGAAVGGVPYHFVGWSNGEGATFSFTSPEGGATLTAAYGVGCAADVTGDGFVNGDDFDTYMIWFDLGAEEADIDHNGFVNGDDFDAFVIAFEAGC